MAAFPPPRQPTELPSASSYPTDARERARALMQRKEEIEEEMEAYRNTLTAHGSDMNSPLVDPEGFPRADIDVYSVRHARSSLHRLRNDHLAITAQIAAALQDALARPADAGPLPLKPHANGVKETKPIAKVNSVAGGSPAESAGLKAQDVVLDFGGVTGDTPGGLNAIGALVTRSEGAELKIKVQREGSREPVVLVLTPRSGWGGRGLLGCHIVPV